MRLADLNAELVGSVADGVLYFDCPHLGCRHTVVVNISDKPYHERGEGRWRLKVWQAEGEFPDSLTLTPSIDIIEVNEKGEKVRTLCWHGHIRNGEVT